MKPPDPDNYLTWSPSTFGSIDFSNVIKITDDMDLGTLRSYFAIAIIICSMTQQYKKNTWEEFGRSLKRNGQTTLALAFMTGHSLTPQSLKKKGFKPQAGNSQILEDENMPDTAQISQSCAHGTFTCRRHCTVAIWIQS